MDVGVLVGALSLGALRLMRDIWISRVSFVQALGARTEKEIRALGESGGMLREGRKELWVLPRKSPSITVIYVVQSPSGMWPAARTDPPPDGAERYMGSSQTGRGPWGVT